MRGILTQELFFLNTVSLKGNGRAMRRQRDCFQEHRSPSHRLHPTLLHVAPRTQRVHTSVGGNHHIPPHKPAVACVFLVNSPSPEISDFRWGTENPLGCVTRA